MTKRILFAIDSLFPLDSGAYQLSLLANQLADGDFEVHVATLNDKSADRHALAAAVQVHCIKTADKRDHLRPVRLRSLIRRLKPDLFHAWGNDAHQPALLAACGMSRMQTICTYLEIPSKNQTILGRWFQESLSKNTTLVVAHETIASQLMNDGIQREFPVITGAVDATVVDREMIQTQFKERLDIPNSARLAGSVARFQPRTRLKDLIWAADLLCCIRDDVHLVLIGSGHQRQRLQKYLWQTRAGRNVHLIDPQDLNCDYLSIDSIAAFDVYWHSHLTQPVPSALLLAMSFGVPVISVIGPAVEQVVRHQQTAMAVNFGARDEFARWTKYIIEQEHQARQLAVQAQGFVHHKFRVADLVGNYRRIYG